jgi:hypothetical protein
MDYLLQVSMELINEFYSAHVGDYGFLAML